MKTFYFTYFTLLDYVRSGNILIEIVLTAVFFAIFRVAALSLSLFLSLGSVYLLGLAVLTTGRLMARAKKTTAYPLIARPLGRGGYLIGNLLASWMVILSMYLLLILMGSLLAPFVLPEGGFTTIAIVVALPIVLTAYAACVAAPMAPLVPGAKWFRFALLLLFSMAFGNEIITEGARRAGLEIPASILAGPFLTLAWPIIAGVKFLANEVPDPNVLAIPLAIMTATACVLVLVSLVLFLKRDLDFK
ncbi:MAG: hypothetical protein EPO21_05840 [Chloroflexota bacterium]|nr:MAG: hypothetical protein EPO21_05840 [Chloroflexota bacterium]